MPLRNGVSKQGQGVKYVITQITEIKIQKNREFVKEKKMNEIKLSGKVCNFKKFEKINVFSLRFYAGKDKEGKSLSGFCPCKTKLDLADGQEINAVGWMGFDSYEKDGKKIEKVCFWVKELAFNEHPEKKIESSQPKDELDDTIPF